MTLYSYEIGSTASTTNLESLSTPITATKSTFHPYSVMLPLGDGTVRGAGWPTAEWRWGFLSQAQRDALRAFCSGASASVYIRTRINDTSDAYKYFTATIIWPIESEERDAGRRLDFVIQFQKMVEYTP